MKYPFFSFIIPVYNIEAYLEECIDSILNQSYTDYEIILINDESTDKSLEICKFYELKDKRVKVLDREKQGVSESRNDGIKHSKGDYIIFVDGDDHLENSGKILAEIFHTLKNNSIDILLFRLVPFEIDEKGVKNIYKLKKIGSTNKFPKIFQKRLYLASPCDKIVKRDLIINNNIKFPKNLLCEDIQWSGDLLKFTNNIVFFSFNFYFYRKNRKGSTTYEKSVKSINDTYIQLKRNFDRNTILELNHDYINKFYANYYLVCIRQMTHHKHITIDQTVEMMKPMLSYLNYNDDIRTVLFKHAVNLLGFRASLKLLTIVSKEKS